MRAMTQKIKNDGADAILFVTHQGNSRKGSEESATEAAH